MNTARDRLLRVITDAGADWDPLGDTTMAEDELHALLAHHDDLAEVAG